jgi:hypothetical protein
MNKKSKIRPYSLMVNAIVMLGLALAPLGVSWFRWAMSVGMFTLIVINYLDGHFETKD